MGEFKVDHATIAFRLALAEASEQEQARADALTAFWQRPVFAATWPSPNEAPRTLTNSHGETALPLFTGLDTLELGADRFSWREPNGSIRFREMSARDALRYALTRQVNFVVIDVGFEHNVEFAREEFESLVLQQDAQVSAGGRSSSTMLSAAASAATRTQEPKPSGSAPRQQSSVSVSTPSAAVSAQASVAQAQTVSVPPSAQAAAGVRDAPYAQAPAGAQGSQSSRARSDQPASGQAAAQPDRSRVDQAADAQRDASAQARSAQPAYAQGASSQPGRPRSDQPGASSQPARPRSDQPVPSPSPAPTPLRAAARVIPQQPAARGHAEAARARVSSSAPPSASASDSMAPKHPSSVPPNLPIAAASSHDAAVSPRLQSGAVAIQQPTAAAAQEASPRQRSGAVPIQPPPSVRPEAFDADSVPPASNPARSQRSISVPPRRPTISASPPPPSAYPPQISETASTIPPQKVEPPDSRSSPTAAPPPRAAGARSHKPVPDRTHPQASFVPSSYSHTAPAHAPKAPTATPQHSSSQPTTPPPRASAELRRTPPPVPEAAKSRAPSTPGVPAPSSDAPMVSRAAPAPANDNRSPEARRRTRDDEPTLAERPNRANTQRGLQASVSDSALEALSSELRGFPEVEWACVLVDESDVPLIAVRIDPSFLNRVADITDVILDVGERQSVTLQVLLLNNQDQVKNARRNGRAFYPWTTATR